jgi:hypothetical protein
MISTELTEAEIVAGAVRVYYPAEDRMLFMAPIMIMTMRYLSDLLELTPSEERLLRDKARRLEECLIEQGR